MSTSQEVLDFFERLVLNIAENKPLSDNTISDQLRAVLGEPREWINFAVGRGPLLIKLRQI